MKAFRSLRTSFELAWGLKFMAKLPGGQAFDEIEPIVMECVPVLHNFFMTFVRNTIYISSFDLSATIMEERSAHNTLKPPGSISEPQRKRRIRILAVRRRIKLAIELF